MKLIYYYRERAAHYRHEAEKSDDPRLREQFDVIASDYDEFAEDERIEDERILDLGPGER